MRSYNPWLLKEAEDGEKEKAAESMLLADRPALLVNLQAGCDERRGLASTQSWKFNKSCVQRDVGYDTSVCFSKIIIVVRYNVKCPFYVIDFSFRHFISGLKFLPNNLCNEFSLV